MADCDAPSFSLGLDLTLHSQSPPHSPSPFNHHNAPPQVPDSDSDPDSQPDPPRLILKRLRRGPQPPDPDPDDDIEEFSSQDDDVVQVSAPSSTSSAWNRSVCSTSKVSLNCSGVLNSSSINCTHRKQNQASNDVPASANMETGQSGLVFPKLTASPLRRFQLIDSDSDDPIEEGIAVTVNAAPKIESCNHSQHVDPFDQNRKTSSFGVHGDQDLWKGFSPVKSVSVPTPVFNEVCEDYFRSAKNKEVEKSGIGVSEIHNERFIGVDSSCQGNQQLGESDNAVPPSHRYFFHVDPIIRQLVRNRLCNFTPLGVNSVDQQPNGSHIDYMGQFNNGGASKAQGVKKGDVKSSTRGKKRSRNLTDEETFNASEGWVDPRVISQYSHGESSRKKATKRSSARSGVSKGKNKTNKSNTSNVSCASENWVDPKSCTSMPKDAGKRRVQASGQSAGHWYTSSDGRKVYASKSGQELTGQIAYRQYRKESGVGLRKSRKKKSTKRKN